VAERFASFGGLIKKAVNKSFIEVYSKECTQALHKHRCGKNMKFGGNKHDFCI